MKKIKLTEEIDTNIDSFKKQSINWYPGHMVKALREIKEKLKLVDIVFEIRDARVPLASGNFLLDEALRQKSRLILLNKANLASTDKIQEWSEWFSKQETPFMFIDCFDKNTMKKVVQKAQAIVDEKRMANNPDKIIEKKKLKLMTIGLPNTGKSTIINQLAGKNVTKTADRPGYTQTQQWITINKDLELLDTPGIMPPNLAKDEHGLWLSAIHAIPDDIVGEERPALFLIDYFIKQNSKTFMEKYKLSTLEISVEEIIEKIAIARGCIRQKGVIDLERVYKLILLDFRSGNLGKCCFGNPPLKK
jgi:ribosome biogenesis GTPase A